MPHGGLHVSFVAADFVVHPQIILNFNDIDMSCGSGDFSNVLITLYGSEALVDLRLKKPQWFKELPYEGF